MEAHAVVTPPPLTADNVVPHHELALRILLQNLCCSRAFAILTLSRPKAAWRLRWHMRLRVVVQLCNGAITASAPPRSRI